MSERGRSIAKRVALAALAVAGLLVLLAVVVYEFGSMESPSPDMRERYARLQAQGEVRPIEDRFHVPIPGCRCHSDDPVLTMQHSTIRIRECSSCHTRGGTEQASVR